MLPVKKDTEADRRGGRATKFIAIWPLAQQLEHNYTRISPFRLNQISGLWSGAANADDQIQSEINKFIHNATAISLSVRTFLLSRNSLLSFVFFFFLRHVHASLQLLRKRKSVMAFFVVIYAFAIEKFSYSTRRGFCRRSLSISHCAFLWAVGTLQKKERRRPKMRYLSWILFT